MIKKCKQTSRTGILALSLFMVVVGQAQVRAATIEEPIDSFFYSSPSFYSPDGYYFGGETYVWSVARGVQDLGILDPNGYISAQGMNANGSVAVGYGTDSNGDSVAFRWTQSGGIESLGMLTMGDSSNRAMRVSGDGNTIVGVAIHPGFLREAWRWTDGGGYEALGYIGGGNYTQPNAINADGSVIVGTGTDSSFSFRAWRWTQATGTMVDLGTIPTGVNYKYSDARFVSDDGSVVGGVAYTDTSKEHVFRWKDGDGYGLTDIGTLGSFDQMRANKMSSDGTVFIGKAYHSGSGTSEAFRWTEGVGLLGLGQLPSGVNSDAKAMNGDASIIVGNADNLGSTSAFIWNETDGMQLLSTVLAGKGINMTGWDLQSANNISQDGNLILGEATNNGNFSVYLVNLASGGLTTPQDLAESLNTVTQVSQQTTSLSAANLSQTLFAARNISAMAMPISFAQETFTQYGDTPESFAFLEPAAGGAGPWVRRSRFSLYTTGSYGIGQNNDSGNHGLDGTVGINMKVTDRLNVGLGAIGSNAHSDLAFGGQSDVDALGSSAIVSYEGNKGLRLYGAAFAATLNIDVERGYANGGGQDFSTGSTDGMAYGGAGQVGWEFDIANDVSIMPYNEWRWSTTQVDAYQETGGAFPAAFSKQDSDSVSSRLGIQFNVKDSNTMKWSVRAAWGHRFDDGGASFTAVSSGLSQAIGGEAGDRDWAEGAVGLGWQATERVRLSGELGGRTGDTAEPQATLTLGASVSF